MIVYVAPTGFESELINEVRRKHGSEPEVHGKLVCVHAPLEPLPQMVWAQNTWLDALEFEIESISQAAKKIRSLYPFMALHSSAIGKGLHRRASLIEDQLPKLAKRHISPLEFLGELPERPLGAWTLLDKHRVLASPRCLSLFPDGEVRFIEDKKAPSRAYLKLWELFTVENVIPKAHEHCLDLGASPGGWSYVLASMGCKVTAIDRSPLDKSVSQMPNVTTLERNAFTLKPEDVGPIDWLFSDIICYPEQLFELAKKWIQSGRCKNFVCTIKFKGETDFATTEKFEAISGARVRHLSQNKHELTWWLTSGG